MERAIPVLSAAQAEVNLWLVAHSIPCQPHFDSVDMNVESHSAAFRIRHCREANWLEEEALCDEMWGDPIYLKIRALVKERTGK
jgi:hypothetical protein